MMVSGILSTSEMIVLVWVSQHRTLAEIALIEERTVAEVERELTCALERLQASTVEDAMVKTGLRQSG